MAIKDLIFLKQRQAPAVLDYMHLVFDTNLQATPLREVTVFPGSSTASGDPSEWLINWGDGTETTHTGDFSFSGLSHTYAAHGTYDVKIYPTTPLLTFGYGLPFTQATITKLVRILRFHSQTDFFRVPQAVNLVEVPPTSPAFTFLLNCFYGCTSFNQDISGWTVSSVAAGNADGMLSECTSFNQNLSAWVFTGLGSTQPSNFSLDANPAWIADRATKFPFLANGVTRINT